MNDTRMRGQTSTTGSPGILPEGIPSTNMTPPSGGELQSALEEFIFSAKAKPGDRLPSERNLATLFSVSRQTLREVLRSMEGQGLIKVQPGRGSFIQDQSKTGPFRVVNAARQGLVTPADLIETISNLGLPLHLKVVEAIEARDSEAAQNYMRQIMLIGQERYGDDLHLPLSKVLRNQAKIDPSHRMLIDAAAEMLTDKITKTEEEYEEMK